MTRLRAGILLFPDVEVLDFTGPFEVLSAARLDESRRREEPSPFDVVTVAERAEPIRATGGLRVVPDVTFDTCPWLDALVVPGGWGTRTEVDNPNLIAWLARTAAGARWVTSVCTGTFLLARAGVVAGRRVTTHWRSLDRLRTTHPDLTVDDEAQVTRDGNIWTSAGIAAGIDLALLVVADACGESVARSTARHMEYPYPDGSRRRVPVTPATP
ncbi:MAG TPA: DJ-1/PfpI family protein [Gemmataceae bacterium]|nr:DJ-1/PfpI family protein [Gemmataceae bacterium]